MKNYLSGIWDSEALSKLDFFEKHFVITTLIIPESDEPYLITKSKLAYYTALSVSKVHDICLVMAEQFPDRYEYNGEYLNVKTTDFFGFMNKITFDDDV